MENIHRILDRYPDGEQSIIQILQDIQREHNYLPRDHMDEISRILGLPLSRLYSIATFYTSFSLEPRGKHLITICMGTACHVREAAIILSEFERRLGIRSGETTGDLQCTLETVNCLGCCAIGPIVVVDGKYMGEFRLKDVTRVLESLS